MKLRALALWLISLTPALGAAAGPVRLARRDPGPLAGAFQNSLPGLSEVDRAHFADGAGMMKQVWLVAPASGADADRDGLGALFNERSCDACHPGNGRGHPPEQPGERLSSALVRLSVLDHVPVPDPVYGSQFNEHGIPGVPGEGRVRVRYTEHTVRLADGTPVRLRQPHLSFTELGYGPLGKTVMTSLRVAPAVFGMGLLDRVDERTLLEYADPDDRNHDGIAGRPNWVMHPQLKRLVIGRFGFKANVSDLHTQIASALSEDIGITNPRFPTSNCTPAETACLAAPSGGSPEITGRTNHHLPDYMMWLAPKQRRHATDLATVRGQALFRSIGCAACHRETLRTGHSVQEPELSDITFHPYSDLLLHDMGPGLSDGRPDGEATARQWRTQPLWGLGLAQRVDPRARFLHDGRARTLTEAILWHDGEAHAARERFRQISRPQREDLLSFLDSL